MLFHVFSHNSSYHIDYFVFFVVMTGLLSGDIDLISDTSYLNLCDFDHSKL